MRGLGKDMIERVIKDKLWQVLEQVNGNLLQYRQYVRIKCEACV